MREIALDTETTGLNPLTGDRIVEIGCVEMINRIRTGNVFHTYLNPERDMPEGAFKIHGLSHEFLKDKPLFRDRALHFLEFIEDAPLVIHNAGFDIKFLNHELKNHGHSVFPMARAIDTLNMARSKFPGSPASLDALCRRFAIDTSGRTKHGALLDAELLADMYLELTGGSQAKMELHVVTNERSISVDETITVTTMPTRSYAASEAELEAHKAFLTHIKKPIWEMV